MRCKIALIMLVFYIVCVNTYMYCFYYTDIDRFWIKLCGYYWPLVVFFGYFILDEMAIYKSNVHRAINIIAKYCVWFNIILITFTYQIPIKKPYQAFFCFDGPVLVTLIMFFISGLHRGIFKEYKIGENYLH